jgi:hypothetical protein
MDKILSPELIAIAPVYGAVALLLVFIFISRRADKLLAPMIAPVPAVTFAAWCAWFTIGLSLLGTTIPILRPFGFIFTFLGIMPFFSERVMIRFLLPFIFMLGVSLLYVIDLLSRGGELFSSPMKPSIWFDCSLIIVWGVGVSFAFRRWLSSRSKPKPPVIPPDA